MINSRNARLRCINNVWSGKKKFSASYYNGLTLTAFGVLTVKCTDLHDYVCECTGALCIPKTFFRWIQNDNEYAWFSNCDWNRIFFSFVSRIQSFTPYDFQTNRHTHTRKSFFLEEMRENRCFDDAHCLFSLLLLECFLFNSNRSVQVFLSSSFDRTCLASVCLANNDLRWANSWRDSTKED